MPFTAFQMAWNDGPEEFSNSPFPDFYELVPHTDANGTKTYAVDMAAVPAPAAQHAPEACWLKFDKGNSVH